MATQQIPESLGPGIEDGAGGVIYGPEAQQRGYPRVVIEPRRNPADVAAEQARTPYRCGFCIDLPTELLAAIREALEQARKEPRQ